MKNKLIYLVKAPLGRYILGGILSFIGGIMSWDGIIGDAIRNWDNFDPYKWDHWYIVFLIGVAICLGNFIFHVGAAIYYAIKKAIQ